MALIFFSAAEAGKTEKSKAEKYILFMLSAITIIVNGIALSAILFRISEMGLTPNRLAVLGTNILILVNLILVTVKLYGVLAQKRDIVTVGSQIAVFLPIYTLWTIFITFILPFLFNFE
jgi:hypothetical protein